jgi:hypothetical protein
LELSRCSDQCQLRMPNAFYRRPSRRSGVSLLAWREDAIVTCIIHSYGTSSSQLQSNLLSVSMIDLAEPSTVVSWQKMWPSGISAVIHKYAGYFIHANGISRPRKVVDALEVRTDDVTLSRINHGAGMWIWQREQVPWRELGTP